MLQNVINPRSMVLNRLRGYVSEMAPGSRLPPPGALARKWRVLSAQVRAAVSIMVGEGTLRTGVGRQLHVVAGQKHTVRPVLSIDRKSAAERLCDMLLADIETGKLVAGQVLPSVKVLTSKHRISDRTVRKAFLMLGVHGSVHRTGKQWIVGTVKQRARVDFGGGPVVIVITMRHYSWRALYADRTQRFCRAFTGEAEKFGVEIHHCFAQLSKGMEEAYVFGRTAIKALISQLEGRLSGILIAASSRDMPDLRQWIRELSSYDRPLVWFDRYGEGSEVAIERRNVFRCCFSEEAAVDLCINSLDQAGHGSAGVFSFIGQGDWRTRRFGMLLDRSQRRTGSRVQIRAAHTATPLVQAALEPSFCGRIKTLGQMSGTMARSALDVLLREVPAFPESLSDFAHHNQGKINEYAFHHAYFLSLKKPDLGKSYRELIHSLYAIEYAPFGEMLRDPARPTCCVCLCDRDAQRLFLWLRFCGVDIPGELSMISFDNYEEFEMVPVSTIDFGLGGLGYAAFHLLFGDVPVKHTSRGEVVAKPHLVNRRSLIQRIRPE